MIFCPCKGVGPELFWDRLGAPHYLGEVGILGQRREEAGGLPGSLWSLVWRLWTSSPGGVPSRSLLLPGPPGESGLVSRGSQGLRSPLES